MTRVFASKRTRHQDPRYCIPCCGKKYVRWSATLRSFRRSGGRAPKKLLSGMPSIIFPLIARGRPRSSSVRQPPQPRTENEMGSRGSPLTRRAKLFQLSDRSLLRSRFDKPSRPLRRGDKTLSAIIRRGASPKNQGGATTHQSARTLGGNREPSSAGHSFRPASQNAGPVSSRTMSSVDRLPISFQHGTAAADPNWRPGALRKGGGGERFPTTAPPGRNGPSPKEWAGDGSRTTISISGNWNRQGATTPTRKNS